jgi:hypothetical protein
MVASWLTYSTPRPSTPATSSNRIDNQRGQELRVRFLGY